MLVDASWAAPRLLDWYDRHARRLPWRAPPGAPSPDPYRVWLSEIMLQQTTTAAAAPYYARFLAAWPSVDALAAADDEAVMRAWAGLGYYARARNLLACARAVVVAGGFPDDEIGLRALPGVGRYTAAAVAAIAWGRRAVVVDGNVERVVARLFAVETPLPAAKPRLYALTDGITPEVRAGDFAQAMMDLGATICTPRRPTCALCPLREGCAAASAGVQDLLPTKAAKKARPLRRGALFWLERGEEVLLVTRPPRGLLGGMLALPTGAWTTADPGDDGAPVAGGWEWLGGEVEHGFTHFDLCLRLARRRVAGEIAVEGRWWPIEAVGAAGLPTLFAKGAARFRAARLEAAA